MIIEILACLIALAVWSTFVYWAGMLHGMKVEAGLQREGIKLYSGNRGQTS